MKLAAILSWCFALFLSGCSPTPNEPGPPTTSPEAVPPDQNASVAAPAVGAPPNIVLVIGDDVGYPYHGFMGDPIVRTPNLDRLAAGGTVFTTGYTTASVCEPSLYSLLTGDAPLPRRGVSERVSSPEDDLPALLSERGYATFQAGKFWHGKFAPAGFDEGTTGGPKTGKASLVWAGGAEGLAVGRTTMQPVFDFIARHADQPFFIWFAPMLPHRPWDAPRPLRRMYKQEDPPLPPSTIRYYANITWLDVAVGQLVEYLEAEGLRSRTLIIYLSDNGYGPLPGEVPGVEAWKGAKGTSTELGFRTPIVFNWPEHISAGVERDDIVSTLDLFPTMLGFAGAAPPEGKSGIDLAAALNGGTFPRDTLIGRAGNLYLVAPGTPTPSKRVPGYFLRDDRWHYIWSPEADTELLFDIAADPRERVDRAADLPEVTTKLRARVEAWRSSGEDSAPRAEDS